MKKKLFYLFALICSMSLFTACDDDDDVDYTEVIESEIAGKYRGTLEIYISEQLVGTVYRQVITVEKASTSAINVLLTDFSFSTISIGDISLENCTLTQSGSSYAFSGTTYVEVTASMLTADVKGTGTVGGGSISMDMNIDATLATLQQDVTVKYTGSKVTDTESSTTYDFEEWATPEGQEGSSYAYYEPTGWCSSNAGAQLLMAFGLTNSYIVMPTDDAYSGEKAALITTINTIGMAFGSYMIPKVTTGSLYLGDIEVDTSNTLNSTKFGIPFTDIPVALKGWYKYTPGEDYYIVTEEPYTEHCHEAVLDETMTDEFIISVVLYTFESGDDYLTGNDIYTSERIVAMAQLTGGEQTSWINFELPLEWKQDYDASKNYYLTIICSSSKDGDKFSGAPGSTLIVDDFELVCE